MNGRSAGVILPLFSARSTASWGIGEIGDLLTFSSWLASAGFDRLMLLPLGTMQGGQASPYATTSTLSIDPIYISMATVPEFARAGGAAALPADAREALDRARHAGAVDYDAARLAKESALHAAFTVFLTDEWEQLTTRASSLAGYVARERWWLDDYALFQAISRSSRGTPWYRWEEPLRERDARALDMLRRDLKRDVLEQQYWQWLAETQWQNMRAIVRQRGIALVGDLPFVAATDSVEVWSRPSEFLREVSTGCPPDAFSPTGQNWGLPTYRWDVIAESDYAWIRRRAKRMHALYDGLRVDHVVGLYRTYAIPQTGEPFFTPSGEAEQRVQGATILKILLETGLDVIAEDLGTVPDFVRESLAELDVPGSKVLRWERDWKAAGSPFLPPDTYPTISAAMSGTHDTTTLAGWWNEAPEDERRALLELPLFAERGITDPAQPWNDQLRDALLALILGASSSHVFILFQDAFGWTDRINTPATVGPGNWTWVSRVQVDRLHDAPETHSRAGELRALLAASGRGTGAPVG